MSALVVLNESRSHPAARPSRPLTIVGVAYPVSWIVGLSVWSPTTAVRMGGQAVVVSYTGYGMQAVLQYLLTEGLPGIGLLVLACAVASAARSRGLARTARLAGGGAGVVSLGQFALGCYLAVVAVPGGDGRTAGLLFAALTRLDGAKMWMLAILATSTLLAARRGALPVPHWLRAAALVLAVSIACSGIGYSLLLPALAPVAYVSLPALLVWVTGTLFVLARRN